MLSSDAPATHGDGPPRIDKRIEDSRRNADAITRWLEKLQRQSALNSIVQNKRSVVAYLVEAYPTVAESVIKSDERFHLLPVSVSYQDHACLMGRAAEAGRSCLLTEARLFALEKYQFLFGVQPSQPSQDDIQLVDDTRRFIVDNMPIAQFLDVAAAIGASSRMFGVDGDWVLYEGSVDASKAFLGHMFNRLSLSRQIPVEGCLDGEMALVTYREHETHVARETLEELTLSGFHMRQGELITVNRIIILENLKSIIGDLVKVYADLKDEAKQQACIAFMKEHLSEQDLSKQFKIPLGEVRQLLSPFDLTAKRWGTSVILSNIFAQQPPEPSTDEIIPYHLRAFGWPARSHSKILRSDFASRGV